MERSLPPHPFAAEALTTIARTDPLAIVTDSAEPPPQLATALTATTGRDRLVVLHMAGATVRMMVTPRGDTDPSHDTVLWKWLRGYVLLQIASHADCDQNVWKFPLREELPDEISALAIHDQAGNRILALNTRQSHDSARASLRKLGPAALVPIVAGLVPDRMARAAGDHPGRTFLIATTIVSGAVFGGVLYTSDYGPSARPPIAMQPGTSPPTSDPQLTPAQSTPTAPTPMPPPTSTGEPAEPPDPRRPTPAPTRAPSPPVPRPSPPRSDRTPSPEQPPAAPTSSPIRTHPPQSAPPAESPPPGDSPATPTADPTPDGGKDPGCNGPVHIEIDPLLDVCLLD